LQRVWDALCETRAEAAEMDPDRFEGRVDFARWRPRGGRRLAQNGINAVTGEGLNA